MESPETAPKHYKRELDAAFSCCSIGDVRVVLDRRGKQQLCSKLES